MIMNLFYELLSEINIKTSVLPNRLKLQQLGSGATDVEINFQKLMYDIGDRGFELTCKDEVVVNKKRW